MDVPNRIIKESICTSDSLAGLSWFEQALFIWLIVLADDYGIYDARPAIIKGRGFPLATVTEKQIADGLSRLETAGIADLYTVGGKPYLQLKSWQKHQQIRASKSKFPQPREADGSCRQGKSDDSSCPRNPIQSQSRTNPDPKGCAGPRDGPTLEIPLHDGGGFVISSEQIGEWSRLYPAVDVEQELRNMIGWCQANPAKRKTRNGVVRFVNGWLARTQDKGGTPGYAGKGGYDYGNLEESL